MIQVLKSKLHRVKVTDANLNYIGSITIDEDLLDAANMIAGEKVQIVDNALMDFEEAKTFKPWVVFPKDNKIER